MECCKRGRICITLDKSSQSKSDVNITPKDDFDFSEALESVYPLLHIILSYLDYSDLKSASKVKNSWQIVADEILNKRNNVSWVTVFRTKRQGHVNYSKNFSYNNATAGIIAFNYHAMSLSDWFCGHDNAGPRQIIFADFLRDQIVPPLIPYCVIGCPGEKDSKKIMDNSVVPLFDCFFLPAIPNVRVSIFYWNPTDSRDVHLKANEKLRCLMLFYSPYLHEILQILDCLAWGSRENVALGGGSVQRIKLFNCTSHNVGKSRLCVAFIEDCNNSIFDASSFVIDYFRPSSFENELMKFKQRIIIRNNSLAFRICWSDEMAKTGENGVFNKIFPGTKLFSIDANTVIGRNCYNLPDDDVEGSKQKRPRLGYPVVQGLLPIVIVFITWGHILHQ